MTGNMMAVSGGLAQPGLLILDLTASALGANELRERLRRDSVTAQIPSLLLAAEVGGGACRAAPGTRIVQCARPKKEARRNFGVTKVAPGLAASVAGGRDA
jgi:hypothetical protein